ncbi:ABC transporter [Stipitochalara longipes BDJ]|nr:ABC transporter [Stipitochalara longipes BDJ]
MPDQAPKKSDNHDVVGLNETLEGEHPEITNVGIFDLYRYATPVDLLILAISTFASVAGGAVIPLMTIIFGQLAGTFQDFIVKDVTQQARDELRHNVGHLALYLVYLAIGTFVAIYVCTVGFVYVGEHISQKIREQYLKAILRQNIGFFDMLGTGEITNRITSDMNLVQDAISQKVALTITALSTFITSFIVVVIFYWKMGLISLSSVAVMVLFMGGATRLAVIYRKRSLESYGLGATVAEEVISSIRDTIAFGTQVKHAKLYNEYLNVAEKWGSKAEVIMGVSIGGMMGTIMWNYGLNFWVGSRYLVQGKVTLANIVTIIYSTILGAFYLGFIAPNMQAFATGIAAASKIFGTINRKSPLDPSSEEGAKLESPIQGSLELREIKLIYPSRPDVVVLDNFSLHIPAGKTTAIVGPSGSGKSSIVSLIERFYSLTSGKIFLDGHEIDSLNLRWLRQQIALVNQEPVLFGTTTILGNIKHGLLGSKYEHASEKQQKELVINAAKMARAHDFILSLPQGYDTSVGEKGHLLSRGQRQRIAIARAVIGDPQILILDEATSALDTKSEAIVQQALDKASKSRTTIVIAHRLSTIKSADNIVVISGGKIIEQGTHNDLLERKASYYALLEAQKIREGHEKDADNSSVFGQDTTTLAPSEIGESERLVVSKDELPIFKPKLPDNMASEVPIVNRQGESKPSYSLWSPIKLVASFNGPDAEWMVLGLVCSVLAGGATPTAVVFFANCIEALAKPPSQYNELKSKVNFWCLMYLWLGIAQFLLHCIHGWAFGKCSERLAHRSRFRVFRTILRQDIPFFEENPTGALTSFLSTRPTNLAGISGIALGTFLTLTTTLIAAIVISISVGWKLGLVCTSTVPILIGCGFLRFSVLVEIEEAAKAAYESSADYACESTSAIRTVASIGREDEVWQEYHNQLTAQGAKTLKSVLWASALYAASQSLPFLCTALGFWYGGHLVSTGEYSLFRFFLCFTEITFGSQTAGTIFSRAPDMGKAKDAANNLQTLFDREPRIDIWSAAGEAVNIVKGDIEFKDVCFTYPSRDDPALKGLTFNIKAGQYVALVGASGCGKSTTISLLERFYRPMSGSIAVDGQDISTLNVNHYRSFLALVSQEPTLYQGTIRDNILLGTNRDDTPEGAIIQACKDSNIYDFIMSLPDGFDTMVGIHGNMLSGGQKQRIVIARAVVRDPRILLLDEATSALDSESEKVVQAALDAASQGRTTIAVAHRLSTIHKADMIYVLDKGQIVEQGTHNELLNRKGKYFELVNLQSLSKMHLAAITE